MSRRYAGAVPDRLIRSREPWSRPFRAALSRYVAARTAGETRRHAEDDPLWLKLPGWLAARRRGRPLPRAVLADIRRGQYCLFLSVRIHDDLFDRHVSDPALVYVGDVFFQESHRAFARHLRSQEFWRIYWDCARTTLAAILELDAAQRRPLGMRAGEESVHARVSAIFKVASAAVCLWSGHREDCTPVFRYLDHVAVAGQILDDFRDLAEDRRAGRLNTVDSALARRRTDLAGVLRTLRHHFEAALAEIRPLGLPPAEQHVHRLMQGVEMLETAHHQLQVKAVFGGLARLPA